MYNIFELIYVVNVILPSWFINYDLVDYYYSSISKAIYIVSNVEYYNDINYILEYKYFNLLDLLFIINHLVKYNEWEYMLELFYYIN